MAEQLWTIASLADGSVLHPCFVTSGPTVHPKDAGWAWDAASQKATKISARPDLSAQNWSGTSWVDDPAKVEAQLIAALKAEAETRKMAVLSAGGAKKSEYAEKKAEVVNYDTLSSGVGGIVQALTTLTSARRQVMFAHATADAAKHGDTLADAIERFRGGISRSVSFATLCAAEAAGCDNIRKATTAVTKRAAKSNVNWT